MLLIKRTQKRLTHQHEVKQQRHADVRLQHVEPAWHRVEIDNRAHRSRDHEQEHHRVEEEGPRRISEGERKGEIHDVSGTTTRNRVLLYFRLGNLSYNLNY